MMGEYIDYYAIELNCILCSLDRFTCMLNKVHVSDKKLLRRKI